MPSFYALFNISDIQRTNQNTNKLQQLRIRHTTVWQKEIKSMHGATQPKSSSTQMLIQESQPYNVAHFWAPYRNFNNRNSDQFMEKS